MFGYIVVNKPEMKFRDFEIYRSYYCGLCRELKEKYGMRGQLTLSYDLTFVILLLSGLYEPPGKSGKTHCAVHPLTKVPVRANLFTEYAAEMNILLTYYKGMDDWKDEKKADRLVFAKLLRSRERKIEKNYPGKTEVIVSRLTALSELEKAGETDIDKVAGCFGRIMEEVLTWRSDEWEASLRRFGFFLGKFIYILDAYEDIEKDRKTGSYNPFAGKENIPDFEKKVRDLLVMMLSEACREFEKLPIIRYGDILRNILYSGVWTRFEKVSERRRKEKEQKK